MTQIFSAEEDFRMVLVGVQKTLSSAFDFMDAFEVDRRCVVDNDRSVYESYGSVPELESGLVVPLHVVVDRAGIVRYYSQQSDVSSIQAAIQHALDDEP